MYMSTGFQRNRLRCSIGAMCSTWNNRASLPQQHRVRALGIIALIFITQVHAAEPTGIDFLGPDAQVRARLLEELEAFQDVEGGRRFLESTGFQCRNARGAGPGDSSAISQGYVHCELEVSGNRQIVMWIVSIAPQSGPIVEITVAPLRVYL